MIGPFFVFLVGAGRGRGGERGELCPHLLEVESTVVKDDESSVQATCSRVVSAGNIFFIDAREMGHPQVA